MLARFYFGTAPQLRHTAERYRRRGEADEAQLRGSVRFQVKLGNEGLDEVSCGEDPRAQILLRSRHPPNPRHPR